VLKVLNIGSHKDKNVEKIDNVILTCFWIKFTDIPLFTLYMITCIETSSNEVSNANDQVLPTPKFSQFYDAFERDG
jgi:hypothetical protein